MRDRIARHRAQRRAGWRTREAPLDLPEAIREESAPDRVLVVDCLTLWLSNVMLAGQEPGEATEALVRATAEAAGPLILVSNEVGQASCLRRPSDAPSGTRRDASTRRSPQSATP